MARRPLNILLSAYACEPDKGSEPGIGWNHALQLARRHEVWVITRANNRAPIEDALRASPQPSLHPVYHDPPSWLTWWKKGGRGVQVYYYLWQLSAYFVARKVQSSVAVDVTQHITFGRYWVPSLLPLLGRPFVWGPIGGADSVPRSFRRSLSPRGRLLNLARDLVRRLADLDPLVRLCAKRSALALATTPATAERLRRLGASEVRLMPAVGLPEADVEALARYPTEPEGAVRFMSVGNLLHWKGFEYGLRGFAAADLGAAEFVVVGDGPERRRLESVAFRLGIAERVRFLGRLPRERVLAELRDCHALVHPSLHDSGGWVCLEAMAAGRPVVCLDLGGPAVLVDDGAGFRIPARTPEEAVRLLAEAMRKIALDPPARASLGERGRSLVAREYSWDRRGDALERAYREALPGAYDG